MRAKLYWAIKFQNTVVNEWLFVGLCSSDLQFFENCPPIDIRSATPKPFQQILMLIIIYCFICSGVNRLTSFSLSYFCKEAEVKLRQDLQTMKQWSLQLTHRIDNLKMVPTLFGVINFQHRETQFQSSNVYKRCLQALQQFMLSSSHCDISYHHPSVSKILPGMVCLVLLGQSYRYCNLATRYNVYNKFYTLFCA